MKLTVEYYRSLLSDVANYMLNDNSIHISIRMVERGYRSLVEMVQHDEALSERSL